MDENTINTPVQSVYVQRDEQGNIQSVSVRQDAQHTEALNPQCDELVGFAQRIAVSKSPLEQSDLGLARVLEDLIDLLVEKQVLRYTDLPAEARSKLLARRKLRGNIRSLQLLDDEDGVI